MNRSKRPLTLSTQKKMGKEVRLAQAKLPPEECVRTDRLKAAEMAKQYPKVEKGVLKSFVRTLKRKKSAGAVKRSKRTTPGEVPSDSPPRNAHIEGKRWIKTIEKQNVVKAKLFSKREAKRAAPKRK
jgi:hypothetical protein